MPSVPLLISRLRQLCAASAIRGLLPDLIMALGFLWVMALAIINSWVSEDAYITFRVIDNFHQGYGLRWNIYERVQAYTHPLWMLLHLPVYALWHNLFYVTITISMACTAGALMLALSTVKKPAYLMAICFFIPLVYSKAFIDYTSSGLENPLSYLLYAWFGYVLIKLRESPHFWFWCSFTVALSLLNRLDTIILYAPTLGWLVWQHWKDIRWKQVFLGASPLLLWFAFSLFYYGFLFPNTKYAKLNTGLRFMRYLYHSLHYIKYFVVMDTLSAFVLFFTPAAWLFYAWRRYRERPLTPMVWMAATSSLGVYGYCVYVVLIGGDYMIGRFWALPLFAAVWTSYVFMPDNVRKDIPFCYACVLLITSLVPQQMKDLQGSCFTCVVGKARMVDSSFTFRGNKLIMNLYPLRLRDEGQYHLGYEGRRIAQSHSTQAHRMFYVGMSGFYAGATVPLIDELALGDALLARLPASKRQNFYAGHFRRDIPRGYAYAINTGSTERMDPNLAQYYKKLRLITSGDLFDAERLKTILYFNLGLYDHWKQDYLRHARP